MCLCAFLFCVCLCFFWVGFFWGGLHITHVFVFMESTNGRKSRQYDYIHHIKTQIAGSVVAGYMVLTTTSKQFIHDRIMTIDVTWRFLSS